MKRAPKHVLVLLACVLSWGYAAADHAVVLVTRADSPIESIDILDVRKIYLGFSVRTANNLPIRAATNSSGRTIYEIFLQDVIAMSGRTYERRLLTLTLQSGRPRPAVYRNHGELIDALYEDETLVSFMWQEEAEEDSNLKILRALWKE